MNPSRILSVSRRTDVPAFYADWFWTRLRAGKAAYRHPFNNKWIEVEISPERFDVIWFWTKNMGPVLEMLPEIEALGYKRYLVLYTFTGLGPVWEPRVPAEKETLETISRLSDRIGPERVIWRFDPIVITEKITVHKTLARFERLARAMDGKAAAVIVSLLQSYGKIKPRIKNYEKQTGDPVREPDDNECFDLVTGLAEIGRDHRLPVRACCSPRITGFGVTASRCLDASYAESIWPGLKLEAEPGPTREGCGCDRAVDIGAYDTCPHHCLYCYANSRASLIESRHGSHDPENPSLEGR